MGRGCCCGREDSPNVAQHPEVCFVFPCNTQEGPADSLIYHNQRSMWGPTDGDQAGVLHLRGETTSAIFAQVPNRCPNGSLLGQSLKNLLLTLMGHFIKKDVLEQADSYPKLAAIDPCDKKKQVHCKHVEFGFAARRSLKSVTDNKTISELAVLTFKTECVQLLSAMTAKLIERCPLKYPLVTYLSLLIESSQDGQLG